MRHILPGNNSKQVWAAHRRAGRGAFVSIRARRPGENAGMSFRTTLVRALEAAQITHCNGQRVVSKLLDPGPEALLKPYVDLAGGATLYIEDMDIMVDEEGRAYGTASASDTEPLVWRFQVVRPLGAADVATLQGPQLKVADVVGRLRRTQRGTALGA